MDQLVVRDSAGNAIHIYHWEAAVTPPKGVVHLIHGASEHIARYGLFAEFLNRNGYAAIGCDLLGHGLSTDTNAFVHFADRRGDRLALESLDLVNAEIGRRYPGVPVHLLGHSMGSFLARLEILRRPDFYRKAVISGSAMTPMALTVFGLFLCNLIILFRGPRYCSPLIHRMTLEANPLKMRKDGLIGERNSEWLTRDVEIQNYYHNSPMCGQPFTVSANRDMVRWVRRIDTVRNIAKGRKDMPLYVFSGALDPLSDYGATATKLVETYRRLGYTDVSFKIYPDDRHEVLNEIDHDVAWRDVLAFLDR